MELIQQLFGIFIHLDKHLELIIRDYGLWTYLILFLIIFCETGLVVTPFLPGDSLLFATGALAATTSLEVGWLLGLLSVAAIAGDTVNYWIGNLVGPRVFSGEEQPLPEQGAPGAHAPVLRKTRREDHHHRQVHAHHPHLCAVRGGGGQHELCPLHPLQRRRRASPGSRSSSSGATCSATYPMVKRNFTLVIMVIIVLSVLPGVVEFVRHRRAGKRRFRRMSPRRVRS